MGLWDSLRNALFGARPGQVRKPDLTPPRAGRGVDELVDRLGVSLHELTAVPRDYDQFTIAKRAGGTRLITAPDLRLKTMQRRILRRLLGRLRAHPAATGFEKGRSIVTNASYHVGADVVLRMDIKEFFASTSAERVRAYFYRIGWNQKATDLLIELCTHEGGLPQGAPTSPRLSNLVNVPLDARLDRFAHSIGAHYTRYADDMTFSYSAEEARQRLLQQQGRGARTAFDYEVAPGHAVNAAIRLTKIVVAEYGYALHIKRKLSIRRRHQCQQVTGLVVNDKVALPRRTRHWLRAVEHHQAQGLPASLTPAQLAGWQALQRMVAVQTQ